ncbi:MAG: glycosyltransferase [Deltaproteobacteria bacterium]|nr:glycosyltransferase [Deltaproteobacteria bacterium]
MVLKSEGRRSVKKAAARQIVHEPPTVDPKNVKLSIEVASRMSVAKLSDVKLMILMPVFNDWPALSLLLPSLEHELKTVGLRTGLLLVDDGSTEKLPKSLANLALPSIDSIEVLSLRRNLGHQRAIAVGLAFIEAKHPCDAVVVMDSDGEDNPRDVPRLVKESIANENKKIIFAARARRYRVPP